MLIPSRVNRQGKVVPEILVDDCFADEVMKHKWVLQNGYPYSAAVGTLHHFVWRISGRPKPPLIDHENRNKLDNRLENLRDATPSLNARNRPPSSKPHPNRDLPLGVYRNGKKYMAVACKQYVGQFDTPEEAHTAYLKARARITKLLP
jgi:hypothetical protein